MTFRKSLRSHCWNQHSKLSAVPTRNPVFNFRLGRLRLAVAFGFYLKMKTTFYSSNGIDS